MNFNQFSFDSDIASNIEAAGYTVPTPIQKGAIPHVLDGRDLLGLAQTGTGKTAAFVLPILQNLKKRNFRGPQALIIAPTRELAEQINVSIQTLGKNLRVRSLAVYGGISKNPQAARLRQGVDILVACPGRLLDHMSDGTADLSGVTTLVLDEADRMFDMGFLPDIRRILGRIPAARQTLLFSATMPPEIRGLADGILSNPAIIDIAHTSPVETVSHGIYPVQDDRKHSLLLAMLEGPASGRVLVFTRTKHRARKLARDLDKSGYRVSSLRGDMTQSARQTAMKGFRDGRYDILVATDVAARGIDVSDISHVINFDMPDTADAYTHRIGRTGRANKKGDAFTIAVQADESLVRDVEKILGFRIERRRLSEFDYGEFMPENQFPERQIRRPAGNRPANSRPNRGSFRGGFNRRQAS